MIEKLTNFIKDIYKSNNVSLHAPFFDEQEKFFLNETIESTFVSSVGAFVTQFENDIANYTGSEYSIACVNGTSGLHSALIGCGVKSNDLVIVQPLTFVANCNAVRYCHADPIFIDVNLETMGMCPIALQNWLEINASLNKNGECIHKESGRRIPVCMPMHTFGHPLKIEEISKVCLDWNILLIEDAAEALGSLYKGRHVGTYGDYGVLSFNGNKIITTGGGGMVLLNQENGEKLRHKITTAKKKHAYEFIHDEVGYNYRMPNINAALGVAQYKKLDFLLSYKRSLAQDYINFFKDYHPGFFVERKGTHANYWLNALICSNHEEREEFLIGLNAKGIQARPIWRLMYKLEMFSECIKGETPNSEYLEERIINLPSGVPSHEAP